MMKLRMTMTIVTMAMTGAAWGGDATPTRDESIALCVSAKEVVVQCKEEMADHFASLVPPDRRASVRAKALREIIEEGSGPLEPRQAKCGVDHDRGTRMGRVTPAELDAVKDCARKNPDCKERVACWLALAQPNRR